MRHLGRQRTISSVVVQLKIQPPVDPIPLSADVEGDPGDTDVIGISINTPAHVDKRTWPQTEPDRRARAICQQLSEVPIQYP
jgi:hypothetical protein